VTRGRPKLPVTRDCVVTVKFTRSELDAVQAAADRTGISATSYLRVAGLEKARKLVKT